MSNPELPGDLEKLETGFLNAARFNIQAGRLGLGLAYALGSPQLIHDARNHWDIDTPKRRMIEISEYGFVLDGGEELLIDGIKIGPISRISMDFRTSAGGESRVDDVVGIGLFSSGGIAGQIRMATHLLEPEPWVTLDWVESDTPKIELEGSKDKIYRPDETGLTVITGLALALPDFIRRQSPKEDLFARGEFF